MISFSFHNLMFEVMQSDCLTIDIYVHYPNHIKSKELWVSFCLKFQSKVNSHLLISLNSVLYKGASEYQDIALLDTKRFGKVRIAMVLFHFFLSFKLVHQAIHLTFSSIVWIVSWILEAWPNVVLGWVYLESRCWWLMERCRVPKLMRLSITSA